MQMENGDKIHGSKTEPQFVGIEKKIAKRFGQIVSLCCIVLGIIASVLSYISSINAVTETIDFQSGCELCGRGAAGICGSCV